MNDLLTFLRVSESGKVQFIVSGKDKSRERKIYYDKNFITPNIFEPYVLRTFIDEVFEETVFRIKEAIVIISPNYYEITQNRGYVLRESSTKRIEEEEITRLRKEFFKVHVPLGMKLVDVAPLHYSIDDKLNITDPIGMFGERLEGAFSVFFVYRNLLHNILASLDPEGIIVKKIVPDNIDDARPFLTTDEKESMTLILVDN